MKQEHMDFARNILKGLDDGNAYFAVYGNGRSLRKSDISNGHRLSDRPDVKEYISNARRGEIKKLGIEEKDVLRELKSLAFSNMDDYIDFEKIADRIDIFKDITRDQAGAIKKIRYKKTTRFDEDGSPVVDEALYFELHEKIKPLVTIGEAQGILRPEDKTTNAITFITQQIQNNYTEIEPK